ncbi:MAG: AcaB family transcriptional regulator [Gammaproteobacteria bacterium]
MNTEIDKTKYRMGIIADITLHTDIAHRFFKAGWSKGNIGLVQFCIMIAKIYVGCRMDDPYADWYLMKTFKVLTEAIDQINGLEQELASYFNKTRGIKLRYLENNKAWNDELYISTEFCHLGAELLTNTDHVLRQLITLQRSGITQSTIGIKFPLQIMQDAFATPLPWKKTDITRNDVRSNNQKAQDTKVLYEGELPIAILDKEIEFSFLPRVNNHYKS